MFNALSQQLSKTVQKLRGIGRLTEDNIRGALKEIRVALLEADVALSVIETFIEQVKEKSIGQEIVKNVRPGDALVKLVQEELTEILGGESATLNFKTQPPMVILMAGLQGCGKTTTAAKLAQWIQSEHKKSVMLTSTDVYRPAAIEQLATLCQQVGATHFPSNTNQKPVKIAQDALEKAKKQFTDVLIVDTAGRLHVDEDLMQEISAISAAISPSETLLVVDSMSGQDAANVAKRFNETLELSGLVLTKTDGDARGGAALSMRMITAKPIKFMGTGEKIDDIQAFKPDRVAAKILGKDDILSLVEEAQQKVDQKKAKKIARKIKKGKSFDFQDFLSQIEQLRGLKSLQSMLSKIPAGAQLPKGTSAILDDKSFSNMKAIISSMTLKERKFPALINGSRKRRLAAGSGTSLQEVNKLLKSFTQMQKSMKRLKGDKMKKQLSVMQGKIPPGMLDQLPPDWNKQ